MVPAPSSNDLRRRDRIVRYKPYVPKEGEDPMAEYMNLLAMLFSMCGLMMRFKWAAWAAVYCAFIGFSNSRSSEDTKQIFSSFMLSISSVVMSYLQSPTPMAISYFS
ncbi:hypothetical protein ACHWQZ_G005159 [Mnemiopsis leidyi]